MCLFALACACACVNTSTCDSDTCLLSYSVTIICLCRYVNGKTYMEDVADALEEAKEEIFITDWW